MSFHDDDREGSQPRGHSHESSRVGMLTDGSPDDTLTWTSLT